MRDSTILQLRGAAEVWGRSFHANAAWLGASCTVAPDAITVRALGHEHVHPRTDVVELRWIWLPFPRFVIVSRAAGECRYSSFQILRWSRLRGALQSCGYSFTEELRYYSSRRVREDIQRYQLQDGVPV